MDPARLKQCLAEAIQHHREGRLQVALDLYRQVLAVEPRQIDALHLGGLILHQQGDHRGAVAAIRQAVALAPAQPVLRNNLGEALRQAGEPELAVVELRAALALRPDYAGAHQNLGAALAALHDYDAARTHSLEATRLDPGSAEAWYNLGLLELDQCRLQECTQAMERALAIRPQHTAAAQTLLHVLTLMPGVSADAVAKRHRAVVQALYAEIEPCRDWPTPGGRIRIGFVSGDFRAHAVNYFFEPVLEHLDRTRFESVCYADGGNPDAVSERLRGLAGQWRDIDGLTDAEVIARVRADRIDVLVDLSGHTRHGRLGVFAARPARCQISWLGYPNTTGLAAIGHRIVDPVTAPADQAFPGVESALRLETGFACFRPPAHAPEVTPAPCLRNGFVTFGSLHKLEKIHAGVIACWAEILRQVPGSHLHLARDTLDDWHRQRLEQAFVVHGIEASRLQLVALDDPGRSFFEEFARIDLMLDVFPWSGHTLACCALWMGVPVVSLRGTTHAGRMVASVLNAIGQPGLVGEEVADYVRIAVDLAGSPSRLAQLRAALRPAMEASPLRDEAGFTRGFETACLASLAESGKR